MEIELLDFQQDAVRRLLEAMAAPERDIVFKSCTGSGKTIVLTRFMYEYMNGSSKTVFVWLTPGKGDLEEQSKEKMDKYVHWSQTKLLADVMTSGFSENDACFINWEKLTKKGNNALKDGERTNFLEYIEKAHNDGLRFNIIVDESHQNATIRSDDIMGYFKADKIIKASATPIVYAGARLVEVPEVDVVVAGLIKKALIINENFEQNMRVEDEVRFLLDRALAKHAEIYSQMLGVGKEINPLVLVQLPNKREELRVDVERYLEGVGITRDNGKLAIWLSEEHENIDAITKHDALPVVLIMKMAVATGWDCPRAYILVKLRENQGETFEIQTIGRIRRMPEARHYERDILDCCYLYTFDGTFTEGARQTLGKGALDAVRLSLKPEHKSFKLPGQQRPGLSDTMDGESVRAAVEDYFKETYKIKFYSNTASSADGKVAMENRKRLEGAGYVFSDNVVDHTKSGEVDYFGGTQSEIDRLNDIRVFIPIDTHSHGRQFHHQVAEIGFRVHLEYDQILAVIHSLFAGRKVCERKILTLEARAVYSFVINNADNIRRDILASMSSASGLPLTWVTPERYRVIDFFFPRVTLFTYNGGDKKAKIYTKSVYDGYRSSAEPRSAPEKNFERYLEGAKSVSWFYKNGDKGAEYLSIAYENRMRKLKLFYPDYIVGVGDDVWIIETKGGFSGTGKSQDIDDFSPIKFEALVRYAAENKVKGGFVRYDDSRGALFICTKDYSDNINSDGWRYLTDVIG